MWVCESTKRPLLTELMVGFICGDLPRAGLYLNEPPPSVGGIGVLVMWGDIHRRLAIALKLLGPVLEAGLEIETAVAHVAGPHPSA